MKNKTQTHIGWIDYLRIFACILVVLAHSCDPFVAKTDSNYSEFLTGSFLGSLVRSCVPLFVMISGVLLLPVKTDMSTFYKKRFKRILMPFVFWSLALPLLYYFYLNFGPETVNPNISMDEHSLNATLTKLYTFVFNFNYDTIPLWYVYMLIGLYLFIPILGGWLSQASKKDVQIVIGIWLAASVLQYVELGAPFLGYTGNGGNLGMWGICDWNVFGSLYYFSGFMGYLILGHYLVKYPLNWSSSKRWKIGLPVILLGFTVTYIGFVFTQKYFPEHFSYLEIIWSFNNINVVMMTVPIFIIAQNIKKVATPRVKLISSLTYGIFLAHFFFVQVVYDLLYPALELPTALIIILITALSFLMTLLVVWILSLNKLTKKFVM